MKGPREASGCCSLLVAFHVRHPVEDRNASLTMFSRAITRNSCEMLFAVCFLDDPCCRSITIPAVVLSGHLQDERSLAVIHACHQDQTSGGDSERRKEEREGERESEERRRNSMTIDYERVSLPVRHRLSSPEAVFFSFSASRVVPFYLISSFHSIPLPCLFSPAAVSVTL